MKLIMKRKIELIVYVFLFFLTIQQVEAQNQVSDSKSESIELLIPSLQTLIDSAKVNNGLVKYRRLEIEAKESNLKSKRKYWTRNFGIQADSRYGTFNNFATVTGDNSTVNLASMSFQIHRNQYLGLQLLDLKQ